MNCDSLLRNAIARLSAAGVDSPRLEGQLLLAQAMGVTRTAVVAGTHPEPDIVQLREFERLVGEREKRVPLAYLRGTQEFYGLTFAVGPAVLIPRPETELLVEFALEKIGAGALADVGTGSGCILTAVLANASAAQAIGFDLSMEALHMACRNADANGVEDRAQFVRGDLLCGARAGMFDFVASNPPYIPTAEIGTLQMEVREREPMLALDGGADGLDCFRRLAVQAMRVLRPSGWLAVEVGSGQAPVVSALFISAGLREVAARRDLAGIERMVCGRKDEE